MFLLLINKNQGHRDDATVKNSDGSSRWPWSRSHCPHDDSLSHVTPYSVEPIPSSDLYKHKACMWYTGIYTNIIVICIKQLKSA